MSIDLIDIAMKAAEKAYIPYSHFPVGAALLTKKGDVFEGCNIESGVPIGLCAERVALCNALVHGARDFVELVIYTNTALHTSPCGVCRQMLCEFSPHLVIRSVNAKKEVVSWKLSDLLPNPFIAEDAGAYRVEKKK